MTKLDFEAKRVILRMCSKGLSSSAAAKELSSEYGIEVTRQTISMFLLHYKRKRSMTRQMGSGRPSKMIRDILRVVEAKMQADDETTAIQLLDLLRKTGIQISLATVKHYRASLGWTFHGTRYCQNVFSLQTIV